MIRPPRLALLTISSLAPACGEPIAPVVPEPDLPTRPDVAAAVDATPDAGDVAPGVSANGCLLEPPTELTGWWALNETQTALVSNVPAIGTMTQTSKSLYLVEITADTSEAAGLVMRARLCDWSTADDIGLTTTSMNPSLFPVLASMSRALTISDASGEPRLTTSDGIQLRGLHLDAPATDAFPTALDDPRVRDEDSDGNPGITLFLNGLFPGTLHVSHRHTARLDGCFKAADTVEGLTAWTTEQLILGSEPQELMDVQPDAQTHPDAALSFFTLRRAIGEAGPISDCAGLKAAREALFPAPPPEPE
jgi:hypothetical protein